MNKDKSAREDETREHTRVQDRRGTDRQTDKHSDTFTLGHNVMIIISLIKSDY